MQRWRPAPSAGSLVGILALMLCLTGEALLVLRAIPAATNTTAVVALWAVTVLLGLAGVAVAVLFWGYLTLSYRLEEADGGTLVLRWAWRTVRIPLDEIEYLGPARPLLKAAPARALWPWPGYYLGSVRDEALGRIRIAATLPPRRQVLVCSTRGSFGISPDRPAQLMARYQELLESGRVADPALAPAHSTAGAAALEDEEEPAFPAPAGPGPHPARERAAWDLFALLQDRVAVWLLLAGWALVVAMLWFIVLRYDAVPQTLPLHFNATGQPDRIGTPREIFVLPLITALVAVVNIALAWSVVRFDRFAARLLLSGTCLVQAVAWVALLELF